VGTPSSRTEPGISPTGRRCGFISIAGLRPTRPLEIKRPAGIFGATVREPRLGAWGVWTSRRWPSFLEKLTPHTVKFRNAAGAIRSTIAAIAYMVRKIVYWTSTVIVAVMLLFAFGNLTGHPQVVSGFTKAGYRTGSSRLADEHGIGVLFDLGCQHHSSETVWRPTTTHKHFCQIASLHSISEKAF
jgi:hypothetical protein